MKSVYCAVRTGSLNNAVCVLSLKRVDGQHCSLGVTGRRLVRAVAAKWSVPTSQNRSALSQRGAGTDFKDQY